MNKKICNAVFACDYLMSALNYAYKSSGSTADTVDYHRLHIKFRFFNEYVKNNFENMDEFVNTLGSFYKDLDEETRESLSNYELTA